ncbi:helix-turn-helix domain-containing protein [Levilactobacillus huananensis]|uniref:helix-turn-helix domain-containing protein n=1 Tax=Levilactobacillus huananensis TaxID=2486019 RepID=UPI000F7AFD58|nr:helix-turn-helix transcriptional regulator [Levilactobacillus huananensis]
MPLFDRIKLLAENQKKSINDVENDLGYSKNTLYRLKRTNPSAKKLEELADYFHVSTDYLLSRTNTPSFTEADEKDIQKTVNDMISGLSNKSALAFMKNGGEQISDDDAELLRSSLEVVARESLILSRQRNKKNNE